MNKLLKFTSDWIWQLPQNLCGIVWLSLIKENIIITNDLVDFTLYLTKSGGGITLGRYMFINQNYTNISKVILDESRYVEQSRLLGLFYIPFIVVESIIHYIKGNK